MTPIVLSIDTSTRRAGVAVSNGVNSAAKTWRSNQNHGRELLPNINSVLAEAGVSLQDVELIAVAKGPGGFSALRVGISTAKGLTLSNDVPLIGVSTFLVEAWPYLGTDSNIVALIDAGSSGVAWGRYAPQDHRANALPAERGVSVVSEMVAQVPPGTLFCGEPCDALADLVEPSRILSTESPTRSPLSLVEIATALHASGEAVAEDDLQPDYARPPSISKPRT
ncbi:MAG: tRNA (adenosine(37)-N6)-threonylcarbamoyltransferase complex dimerization subunit type 1 TsaB [Chloroflexi bacterium]|nr:tRNA (adenosine(37)-N6)-threonylcarbamoyltransferase complex dimerization subunit type 1 TsaB [Chloroflexota bacterium]